MANIGRDWRDKVYRLVVLEEVELANLEPVYKSKGPSGTIINRARITIPRGQPIITPLRVSSRWAILNRDGFRCYYCGRTSKDGANLHIDHVVPLARGGLDDISNLITSCEQCNLGKSTTRCLNEDEVLTEIERRNNQ